MILGVAAVVIVLVALGSLIVRSVRRPLARA